MASSKLQIDNGVVKDDLNCVNCKSVPKDACLVPCGCRLCRICINDLMASGVEFCPGSSEECGESSLLQSVTDYRANRKISKLSNKCPNNGCVHEDQLVSMEEHLRVCPRNSIEYSFPKPDCTQDRGHVEDSSVYLHGDRLNYREILMGVNNNVNNEMEDMKREIKKLKKTVKNHKREIGVLKIKDENKKIWIEVLKSKIENNKRESEDLKWVHMCDNIKIDILEKQYERTNIVIKVGKKNELPVIAVTNDDNIEESGEQQCELEVSDRRIKSIMNDNKVIKGNKVFADQASTSSDVTEIEQTDECDELDSAQLTECIDKGRTSDKENSQSINQRRQYSTVRYDSIKSKLQNQEKIIEAIIREIDDPCHEPNKATTCLDPLPEDNEVVSRSYQI